MFYLRDNDGAFRDMLSFSPMSDVQLMPTGELNLIGNEWSDEKSDWVAVTKKIMDNVAIPIGPFAPIADATELGVRLSWSPKSAKTGYNIYRSTIKGVLGEKINSKPILGGAYFDVNAAGNTTYFYTIVEDGAEPYADDAVTVTTEEILGGDKEGTKNYILMKIGRDTMLVNEDVREIDPGRGTAPLIKNGRTLVPIRAIIEAMGGAAGWDAGERKVSLTANAHSVAMWINQKNIVVDGESKTMDVVPEIINDRTMLPIRFVVENIDCQIAWIGSTQEIVVLFYTTSKGA
jgi:hypothetical protein